MNEQEQVELRGPERRKSAVETWTDITGDSYEAAIARRVAYDRWFSICVCGHGPEQHHDDPAHAGLTCSVKRCGCTAYDHITGKPDHPLNPLSPNDPRVEGLVSALEEVVRAVDEDSGFTWEQIEEWAVPEKHGDGEWDSAFVELQVNTAVLLAARSAIATYRGEKPDA